VFVRELPSNAVLGVAVYTSTLSVEIADLQRTEVIVIEFVVGVTADVISLDG
jgi:hypothetical protein